MKKFIIAVFMCLLTFIGVGYAESKEVTPLTPPANISLYEQPDVKSKVIGTVTPGTAIIPIFSQGNWVKVGNPTNGQVGWMNNEVLPAQNQIYVKTVTKNSNTPGNNGSQIIQYSSTEPLDEKQMGQLMQNLQNRQAELQQVFDQILNQSVANFNVLLRELNQQTSRPWVVPGQAVIVAPETKAVAPQTPAPSSQQANIAPAPQTS